MKTLRFLLILFITSIVTPLYATEPQNLTVAKRAVISYFTSGEYQKDVDQEVQKAEKYLLTRIEENNRAAQPHKLAVILDIDDTSLSNFEGNKKRDFSGLPEMIDASYREANAPAIEPVLRLYNTAIKNGVAVFFLTFRPDSMLSYTITNLQKSGYNGWTHIYLPNSDEIKLPAQEYKTNVRAMLTRQGYDIILNLGDQDSDLKGGYAEATYKIPNPLYSTSKEVLKRSKSNRVSQPFNR